jgi:hypothetical protein
MIAPKPRELSHIEAASVPVVAVTASLPKMEKNARQRLAII